MPQGMQYTVLEGQCLTLSKQTGGEESTLIRLQKASVFSAMADECTDIMAVEEFSVFCHWEEDGTLVECFLELCL